jgi:hypothetical protein
MWKIFMFFMTLSGLHDHEEGAGLNRPARVQHGVQANRKNRAERRRDEFEMKDRDPTVLIVGESESRKLCQYFYQHQLQEWDKLA